jgi:hypothetical protein
MNVVRFQLGAPAAFTTHEIILVFFSVRGCVEPRSSVAGRIMSMKNSSYTIGNRTRVLPACSAVAQPTAPPAACPIQRALPYINNFKKNNVITMKYDFTADGRNTALSAGVGMARIRAD